MLVGLSSTILLLVVLGVVVAEVSSMKDVVSVTSSEATTRLVTPSTTSTQSTTAHPATTKSTTKTTNFCQPGVASPTSTGLESNSTILVGGQRGKWFQSVQYPELYAVSSSYDTSFNVDLIPGQGTVWGGNWNGSGWLITGWGECDSPIASNPYILFLRPNGTYDYLSLGQGVSEWRGGDIFSASTDGNRWLVSGMGSGWLPKINPLTHKVRLPPHNTNHYSLGILDGDAFSDLSQVVPEQRDGVLFSNAFNGTEWLIGGGWQMTGVLFAFNGRSIVDLGAEIRSAVPTFHSVQSVSWNGHYWLIGGVGFLAKYEGNAFTNLTPFLNATLQPRYKLVGLNAVNSIAWNGTQWMIGGGAPIACLNVSSAWLASFSGEIFQDQTPLVTGSIGLTDSSVLVVKSSTNGWIIGGYSGGGAMLLHYEKSVTNLAILLGNMTYVDWIGTRT